jgi:hypothetical protein
MTRIIAALSALLIGTVLAIPQAAAQQKPPGFGCGGSPPQMVTVTPVPKFSVIDFTNQGADCAMWQTFFYLNWPVTAGQRGIPNLKAKFGTPGTTVWESFKTVDQVFLPGGAIPAPWNANLKLEALASPLVAQVGSGSVRLLSRTSKISREVIGTLASAHANDKTFLDSIQQAGGGTLWDQQKRPVYYEIAMNKMQFDYITTNTLYSSAGQAAFTKNANIALPVGSIELKAAWKIMTAAEASSGRFYTTKAYLLGPNLQPVTVGLVGLHVFTGGGNQSVGIWGTFAQVDNAPVQPAGPVAGKTYTFFNPQCAGCPLNSQNTKPTQVVQMFPDDSLADKVNKEAQGIIVQYNQQNNVPKSPWQYYKLIDAQWSPKPVDLKTTPPLKLPLPEGTPSTDTLMNAVLETFMQQKGTSCLQCHSMYAGTAPDATIGSGYSFMFSNAK